MFDRQPCKNFVKRICTFSPPCDFWLFPKVNSVSPNRVADSAVSARLHTGRLRDNPAKSRRRKSAVAFFERRTTVGLRISGHSHQNLYRFYGRAQKSWDQPDEYDSQKLRSVLQTSEKTKVRRSEKCKSKFLSAVSLL